MRNKFFILGAGVVIILLLGVVFVMFFFGNKPQDTASENPFPDTSDERPFPVAPNNTEDTNDVVTGWQAASTQTIGQNVPLLRRISTGPAIGPTIYTSPVGNEAYVRFVLRNGGKPYETPLARITEPKQLSDREVLRVGDVQWSPNGVSQLVRYTNDVHEEIFSFLGTFPNENAVQATGTSRINETPSGRPLPNGIVSATFSPKGDSLFYIMGLEEQGSRGYVESVTTNNRVEVWSTPFSGITAHWGAPDSIIVYNNPSITAEGAVWSIHAKTFAVTPLLGGEFGLSARINTKGTHLLYTLYDAVASVYSLRMLDMETGLINYLPLPTIAEKCVWGIANPMEAYCAIPRNMDTKDYLQKWQLGTLLSDDVIWRFDAVTGLAKMVLDPKEYTGETFDIIDLSIDTNDTFITFRTRKNEMIWAVQLPKRVEPTE